MSKVYNVGDYITFKHISDSDSVYVGGPPGLYSGLIIRKVKVPKVVFTVLLGNNTNMYCCVGDIVECKRCHCVNKRLRIERKYSW
jgi:hypothetical protein